MNYPGAPFGRDPRRRLTVEERRAAFARANGRCQNCGKPLGTDYHDAHLAAWTRGGATNGENIEPQCMRCNLSNGSNDLEEASSIELRLWQEQALPVILERTWQSGVATVNAAPGAGKTYFALAVFAALRAAGYVERLVVVCPNLVIVDQWKRSAGKMRIHLDTEPRDGHLEHPDTCGAVVSYQLLPQPAGGNQKVADMHRARIDQRPTMIVLDEVHHVSEKKSWGEAVARMVGDVSNDVVHPAAVLNMTGTLFRSGRDKRISTVRYIKVLDENGEEKLEAQADWSISTAELIGHELRPPDLYVYNSRAELMDLRNNATISGDLGDLDKQQRATALRGLDKSRDWLRGFATEAVRLLDNQLAAIGHSEPLKLLYCANDIKAAKLAADAINEVTGRDFARLIVSDDTKAKEALKRAAAEPNPCAIVQVKMASEGFDCPEVSTIAYASTATADLSIAQMMARAMRITGTERAKKSLLPAQILIPDNPDLREVFAAVLAPLPRPIDIVSDECQTCGLPQPECVCPCPRCGRPRPDCICCWPPPPGPRYELIDLTIPELQLADVIGQEDGEVANTELIAAEPELLGLGIPAPYHPRAVVYGRRQRTVVPKYAPAEPVATTTTVTVEEANPRDVNRTYRERLRKAAGWMKQHIDHDFKFDGVAQFQYHANQAPFPPIPKGGRDHASSDQLRVCAAWMCVQVREHCRLHGEEVPTWAEQS